MTDRYLLCYGFFFHSCYEIATYYEHLVFFVVTYGTTSLLVLEFLCFSLWNLCYPPHKLMYLYRPEADVSH